MSSGTTHKKSVFGAYDIRGVYGEGLDRSFAKKLGLALAQHIGLKEGRFVIGHDARQSSPVLAEGLTEGLTAAGQSVTLLGLASTPRLYWHGAHFQFDAAIAVTASHLPAKHNGFKLCRKDAVPISSEDGLGEVEKLMEKLPEDLPDSVESKQRLGTAGQIPHDQNGLAAYRLALAGYVDKAIGNTPLTIVIDGSGSPVGGEIEGLWPSSVKVHALGFSPDGEFSRHSANPLDQGAVDEVVARVRETKADLGAVFDGDGDRVIFVDEQGAVVDPALVTALLAEATLVREPGATIMFDLRSSRAVPEAVTRYGGKPMKCRVGHSFIKADMRKHHVALAGELSAHYYWSDLHYTDNALRAVIELVNVLSRKQKPLSELVRPLDIYPTSGEINFKTKNSTKIISRLKEQFQGAEFDFTDGLTVEMQEWWFNARTSQTEPMLRLCLGAKTKDLLEMRRQELVDLINAINH